AELVIRLRWHVGGRDELASQKPREEAGIQFVRFRPAGRDRSQPQRVSQDDLPQGCQQLVQPSIARRRLNDGSEWALRFEERANRVDLAAGECVQGWSATAPALNRNDQHPLVQVDTDGSRSGPRGGYRIRSPRLSIRYLRTAATRGSRVVRNPPTNRTIAPRTARTRSAIPTGARTGARAGAGS